MRLKVQRFHRWHAEAAAARRGHKFTATLPTLTYFDMESGVLRGLSTRALAKRHSCSQSHIVRTLKRYGLSTQYGALRALLRHREAQRSHV